MTLHPGVYRFDGWPLTTPGYQLKRSQMMDLYSAPGYAFLWNVDDNKIEALASL